MTRSQNVGKFTQFHRSDHIFGKFCHQASSCIHTYPKKFKICRKKISFFSGGQNELALMTLSRNSKKLTEIRQIEHMFVNFRLQASSPVRSYPKKSNYCQKLQFFLGGWKKLTLMILSRNFGRITKVRQSEHIFGTFSLQASTCINSHTKISIFCRIMQTFVGGLIELTLLTLSQNSRKTNKNFKVNTFPAILAFSHLVTPTATQK